MLLKLGKLRQHLPTSRDPSIEGHRCREAGLALLSAKPQDNSTGNKEAESPAWDMQDITDHPLAHQQTSPSQSQRPQQRLIWKYEVWQ